MNPLLSAFLRYVLPVLAVAGLLWWAYDTVYDRGFAAAQAECSSAGDKANANNEQAASTAGAKLNDEVGQKLPAIQRNAYESADRIHTVYVDRPVPGECAWSGGVLDELEAGRKAANRAVRGGTGGDDSTHSSDSR